jgi:hypothetical protein
MDLAELKKLSPGFIDRGHAEKIKFFGRYLHAHRGKETFQPADIKALYDSLHDSAPSSFGGYFANLVDQKCLLKSKAGYRLSGGTRDSISAAYVMEELKEAEVIGIAKDAGIIAKDIWKILEEKLGKRNSAAHASSVIIGQLQADALIDDLVKNVVVKIV